jgi:tetratricopeptide (TPR) repeat protein
MSTEGNPEQPEQKTQKENEYGEFGNQNEYGEFASEGMEGVNETIADETGEVKKEREPIGGTGSQALNFFICSVVGVIIFAIYMDWE